MSNGVENERPEVLERSGQPDGYEVVEHTADWALRVFAPDLNQLFVQAARGLTSLLVAVPEEIPLEDERTIVLEAFDGETLLVDWLSELAFLAEDEMLVYSDFEIRQISDTFLSAVIRGGRATELLKHVKAVTYHNLAIEATAGGYTVTVVFDV